MFVNYCCLQGQLCGHHPFSWFLLNTVNTLCHYWLWCYVILMLWIMISKLWGHMNTGIHRQYYSTNKNVFQLKTHLPLANRKSNTYNLTLEWPWPCYYLNLIDELDLRQVKLMSRCQISIFHEMTLTMIQLPWYDLDPIYDLDLRQVKLS